MNADTFNALYEVGIPVFAYPGARPEDFPKATRLVTRTRSKATVLGGHTDVVWVDGHSACIALSHVDVVSEDEWKGAQTAEAVAECGALPVPAGLACPSDAELADYATVDFTELMDADAAAVVERMRDRLIGEIQRQQAELGQVAAEIARFGIYGAALPATKALVKRADELVTEKAELRSYVARIESALCECVPERDGGSYLHAAGCLVADLQQAEGAAS